MKTKKRNTTGLWVTVTLFGMLLFFSVTLNLGLFATAKNSFGNTKSASFGDKPIEQFPDFDEVWTFGTGTSKVVHIEFNGAIMRNPESGGLFARPDPVESVIRQIRAATSDSSVRAIIFEINSPGGAVTASDEIYMALSGFRGLDGDRKVLIFTRDLAASGAFYIAMAVTIL